MDEETNGQSGRQVGETPPVKKSGTDEKGTAFEVSFPKLFLFVANTALQEVSAELETKAKKQSGSF